MTHYQPTPSSGHGGSTAEAARDEASSIARNAQQSGGHLVDEGKGEAREVGHEAARQARTVLDRGRSELTDQASVQQQKVAESIRAFGGELGTMAEASDEPGVASDLARQVAGQADSIASWIADREPGALLDEVKTFARNRPGTFLALALGAGVVAGRLTRGVKDAPEVSPGSSGQRSSTEPGGASHRAPGSPSTSTSGADAPTRTSAYGTAAGAAAYGSATGSSAYGETGGSTYGETGASAYGETGGSTYGDTGDSTYASGTTDDASTYGTGSVLDEALTGDDLPLTDDSPTRSYTADEDLGGTQGVSTDWSAPGDGAAR